MIMAEKSGAPRSDLCVDGIEIPGSISDPRRFRAWADSGNFPERGFVTSDVLGASVRLVRNARAATRVFYRLEVR